MVASVEVYMIQRSPTDTAYPGEWHCPGSVLRPREEISDVFARLQKKEFGQLAHLGGRRFVANVNHPAEARGHLVSLVYLCELVDDDIGNLDISNLKGKWFPVDHLPEKTVESHVKRIIPAAVGAFVAENTKICK
jgi:ADP-ribose pyrophosphatase YjhB (NUDIX family)